MKMSDLRIGMHFFHPVLGQCEYTSICKCLDVAHPQEFTVHVEVNEVVRSLLVASLHRDERYPTLEERGYPPCS